MKKIKPLLVFLALFWVLAFFGFGTSDAFLHEYEQFPMFLLLFAATILLLFSFVRANINDNQVATFFALGLHFMIFPIIKAYELEMLKGEELSFKYGAVTVFCMLLGVALMMSAPQPD